MGLVDIVKDKVNPKPTYKLIYSKLVKNADNWFPKIGQGSARKVYIVSDEYVIKLAKNAKGIAQNQKEYGISRDGYYDDITAKILGSPDDMSFVVMEQAQKITKKEFLKLNGFSIDWLNGNLHATFNNRYRMTIPDEGKPQTDESWELYYNIENYVSDYIGTKAVGDIGRISSWGKVIRDGKPKAVLVDYGLDDSIYKEFYDRRRKG